MIVQKKRLFQSVITTVKHIRKQTRWLYVKRCYRFLILLLLLVMLSLYLVITNQVQDITSLAFAWLLWLGGYLFFRGGSALAMMSATMLREEPLLSSKHILPPGRYIRTFGSIKERPDSPLNDYEEFFLFTIILMILGCVMSIHHGIAQHSKEVIASADLMFVALGIQASIQLYLPRLEAEYEAQLGKAKQMFFDRYGKLNELHQDWEYQKYQVTKEQEEAWLNELLQK